MPSIVAHLFLGLLICAALGMKKKSLLLFGCLLPDIKAFGYALFAPALGVSEANAIIIPVHTPFGSLLAAAFFASLLGEKRFRQTFLNIALGAVSHHLLDGSMYPFCGIEHYLLLFPYSWDAIGFYTGGFVECFSYAALALVPTLCALEAENAHLKGPRRNNLT